MATNTGNILDDPLTPPSTSNRHRCYLCSRTYERADHLSRHLRSHENERTYRCPDCGKGFNRAWVLVCTTRVMWLIMTLAIYWIVTMRLIPRARVMRPEDGLVELALYASRRRHDAM